MLTITNGVETFVVPEGAAKIYKNMGFRPVGGTSTTVEEPVHNKANEVVGDNIYDDLLSKPISQWNQDEVKEFAAAKGYDVSEAKSLKQAKAIIKDALDAEERALAEE